VDDKEVEEGEGAEGEANVAREAAMAPQVDKQHLAAAAAQQRGRSSNGTRACRAARPTLSGA